MKLMDNDELMCYIAENAIRPGELHPDNLELEREIMRQVRHLMSDEQQKNKKTKRQGGTFSYEERDSADLAKVHIIN